MTTTPLRVLHLVLRINETSAPYNEHCRTHAPGTSVGVVTYFPSTLLVHPSVTVFEGDGSASGFRTVLRRALDIGPWDVLHAHAVHFAPFLAGRRRPPALLTLHTSYSNVKRRNRMLAALAFAISDQVVCCSRASRDSLPPLLRRFAHDRVEVIPNGVDLDRIDRRRKGASPHLNGHGFTVISVGRLLPVKDPLTLVRSLDEAPARGMRLLMVGEGDLAQRLRREAADRGLSDRVAMAGLVPRDEVFPEMAGADVFASAARVEGLPVATLEAMACGTPVVLTDIPAHREIVDGLDVVPLVPVGDAAAFARELARLRDLPAEERRRIGALCRAHVERRFSLARMHEGYAQAYARLAGRAA